MKTKEEIKFFLNVIILLHTIARISTVNANNIAKTCLVSVLQCILIRFYINFNFSSLEYF